MLINLISPLNQLINNSYWFRTPSNGKYSYTRYSSKDNSKIDLFLTNGVKNQDFINEINLIDWNDIYYKLTCIGLLVN